jgi:hypothetical protein
VKAWVVALEVLELQVALLVPSVEPIKVIGLFLVAMVMVVDLIELDLMKVVEGDL